MSALSELEPRMVWELFEGLTRVPRPSKQEERIRAHVRELAARHGLEVEEEAVGNLIIQVPASPGHEGAPTIVLQAHLDMVCEKNRGTQHDFDCDPIPLLIDPAGPGGRTIVRADGTTLGADNGIGVALALAAALSDDLTHGPLELLFTIDEEAGMTGAKALTPGSFRGRTMLNLDSEEDDVLYIGCAGGCDSNLSWTVPTERPRPEAGAAEIQVLGLRGGHSGGDIHENRGNAIKLLVRTLLGTADPLHIAEFHGGSKRNAIPREASAVIVASPQTLTALREAAEQVAADARLESAEPELRIEVQPGREMPASCLSAGDSARILAALAALPHGVLGMSPTVPGLVQTSNNLATVETGPAGDSGLCVVAGTLSRSSSNTLLRHTCQQIAAIGRLAGADIETANEYPGWEPDPDSAVLATARQAYERVFGGAPGVAAIHAGLECGIIGQRVGAMDMVSFGPTIEGAHSPDERVYVDSVAKMWSYLQALLEDIARKGNAS